jgi:hypothetical protein
MSPQETKTPGGPEKKPYHQPVLRVFGTIAALTGAGMDPGPVTDNPSQTKTH